VFTEPLPSNDRKDYMKYAVEMGSGAMIYVESFMKTGSGIQKLLRGLFTDTQTAW
jgi:hypothetical protein